MSRTWFVFSLPKLLLGLVQTDGRRYHTVALVGSPEEVRHHWFVTVTELPIAEAKKIWS